MIPIFNKAVALPATRVEQRLPSACSAVSYYYLLDNRKPPSQILYACCLLRRDYAKHQRKRKEKKRAKEEHEFSGQHETEQFFNCTNESGEIAAIRITADKDSQKKEQRKDNLP